MGFLSCSNLMTFVFMAYVCFAGLSLKNVMYPEECSDEPCLRPLHSSERKVDVYVYTSTSGRDALKGSAFRKLTPLWNSTGLGADDEIDLTVNVSPYAKLIFWGSRSERCSATQVTVPDTVRANGTLHAHVFIVTEGTSPDASLHKFTRTENQYYEKCDPPPSQPRVRADRRRLHSVQPLLPKTIADPQVRRPRPIRRSPLHDDAFDDDDVADRREPFHAFRSGSSKLHAEPITAVAGLCA